MPAVCGVIGGILFCIEVIPLLSDGNTINEMKLNVSIKKDVPLAKYPDLLTVGDLQEILGIGRTVAYKLIKEGVLAHIRIGRSIRIPKRILIDLIDYECYNGRSSGIQTCHNEEVYFDDR